MASDTGGSSGGGFGNIGSNLSGIVDALGGLFGTSSNTSGNGTEKDSSTSTSTNAKNTITSFLSYLDSLVTASSKTSSRNDSQTTSSANTTGTTVGLTTGTSDVMKSSDPFDLAASRATRDLAMNNADNAFVIGNNLTGNIFRQAEESFAPTLVSGHTAGLYNDTSTSLLRDNAITNATSSAQAAILDYQTKQEQIASTTGAGLLEATSSSKGTTGGTSSQTNNSTTASAAQTVGSTSGTSDSTQSTKTTTASQTLENLIQLINSASSGTKDTTTTANTQKPGLLDSVICTELMRQGKLERKLWHDSSLRFSKYPVVAKKAYWIWGRPVAKYIASNPTSYFTFIVNKIMVARTTRKLWAVCLVASFTVFVGLTILPYRSIRSWLITALAPVRQTLE